ncbi:MAG: aminotransferase class IV [Solirubrobacteraceae bacterium]|jgi:branched-chain amino acid aminotransferase
MALACINGTVGPAEQATIPATDEGLLRGDGAFEVLRLYGGRPFALDDHLARLERSSANLRLTADVTALRSEVKALLAQAEPIDALLRLVVTRGGRRLALIEALPQMPDAVRLGYVTYAPTRVLDGIKSLSYAANMLSTRLAQERGFDEALLVTPHGRVLEGPTSSFFWLSEGRLRTPPLSEHILGSITRARLVNLMDVSEEPCTTDDAAGADEAFLASTVREVLGVSAIEGVDLPAPGPVTAEAARRLREQIEQELSPRAVEDAREPA